MNSSVENTTNVRTSTSFILNNNGLHLFCKYWEPVEKPKALVFIAHGYAEHCLPYESLALTLASKSYLAFAHDHAGHGQSEGARVQIDSFDLFIDDVFQHSDMMRQKFPDLPFFICGHSMGGAISILAAVRKPQYFKGVILIGPAVMTNPEIVKPITVFIAKILRRIAPKCPVGKMDYALISSDPAQIKAMQEDPLRYQGYAKAGLGACLVEAMEKITKIIPTIKFPFVIYQGEDDKICIPQGAAFMYEKAASEDKTIKMYPKAFHCLHLEPNGVADDVTDSIAKWITVRL